MSETRIAERYARGYFRILPEAEQEDALKHLEGICQVFDEPKLARVLNSPVVPGTIKLDALAEVLKQTGANTTVQLFVKSVVEAGRVSLFPNIARSYRRFLNDRKGVLTARVVAASVLPEATLQKLTQALSEKLNKKVTVETSVDESLLGGFVVELHNAKIDLSLKSKLETLASHALV